MKVPGRCLLWLLLSVQSSLNETPTEPNLLSGHNLKQAIEAIHLSLDYIYSLKEDFSTPDALFALSMTLGQLEGYSRYLTYMNLLQSRTMKLVFNQMQNIKHRITKMVKVAREVAKQKHNSTYKDLETLFDPYRWQFSAPRVMTNKTLRYDYLLGYNIQALNEFLSDHCIILLLGRGYIPKVCATTDYCWLIMTTPSFSSYSSTHQLLYFIVGERLQCRPELNVYAAKYNMPPVSEQLKIRCANILGEAEVIAEDQFELQYGDLFLEQSVLCGMLGYKEFFRPDWLQGILTWQHNSGCFSNFQPSDRSKKSGGHVRQKRLDSVTRDNCSTHFTALAVVAFGQYIRHTIDDHIVLD